MTIYERINPFRRLHYSFFWIILFVAFFVIQQFLVQVLGDPRYLFARILIASSIAIIPIFGNIVGSSFQKALDTLEPVINLPSNNYKLWAKNRFDELFNYKGEKAKIAVMTIVILTEATIFYWGFPYRSIILNITYLISVQVLLFAGSLGAYALVGILSTLYEITQLPIKVPFYANRLAAILFLSKTYNIAVSAFGLFR